MSKRKHKPHRTEAARAEEERPAVAGDETSPPVVEKAVPDEAAQWREKYMRILAEQENSRKRLEREKEQARCYALESFLRDFLPVLDALECALAAQCDAGALREGVGLAMQDALRILKEKGLEPIEVEDQPFDPRWHEATAAVPVADKTPGTVLREVRRGYRFRDRVLRASRVEVAMPVPEPQADDGEDACPPTTTAAKRADTPSPPSKASPKTL